MSSPSTRRSPPGPDPDPDSGTSPGPDKQVQAPARRRGVLLGTVGGTVVLIIAIVVAVVATSGGDDQNADAVAPAPAPSALQASQGAAGPSAIASPSAQPSPPPVSASQPAVSPAPAAAPTLPRPARTGPGGLPLGFPRSTAGAVSALVRWDPFLAPADEARQVAGLRAVGTARFVAQDVPQVQAGYRADPLPAGAWAKTTPLGVKVISADQNQVTVALLDSMVAGVGQGPTSTVYTRTTNRLVWSGADWQLDAITGPPAQLRDPASDKPKDIVAAGWDGFHLS
ncbi:putative GerMN domain-containing protein [Frankia sp. AiPs1]|uniref:hypothetical protein n=1 Tax=Frankia sp. AiPa1 TaxID=573492 RepID=UPI00202B3604|nr:hypothetical protein [Frankia sp. AiPa1]MCL9761425.1 hypothetical protein [Frankia sp. AiPa1]